MDGLLIIQICYAFAFAIVCIIALFLLIGIIVVRFICERKYKKAVIDIVKRCLLDTDEDVLLRLLGEYKSCNSNTFNIVLTDITTLNNRVLSDLNTLAYKKYHADLGTEKDQVINKIEKVIKLHAEKAMFSYEKMNELTEEICQCTNLGEMPQLSIKVKNLYEVCLFYCDGRLFEKEAQIYTLKNELEQLKKKKIFAYIVSGIGLISGIITIITAAISLST